MAKRQQKSVYSNNNDREHHLQAQKIILYYIRALIFDVELHRAENSSDRSVPVSHALAI